MRHGGIAHPRACFHLPSALSCGVPQLYTPGASADALGFGSTRAPGWLLCAPPMRTTAQDPTQLVRRDGDAANASHGGVPAPYLSPRQLARGPWDAARHSRAAATDQCVLRMLRTVSRLRAHRSLQLQRPVGRPTRTRHSSLEVEREVVLCATARVPLYPCDTSSPHADCTGGVARTQKATSLKAVMPSAAAVTGPAFTGLKAQSTMVRTCSHPALLALQ